MAAMLVAQSSSSGLFPSSLFGGSTAVNPRNSRLSVVCSSGRPKEKFTFSSSYSTLIPLSESPTASIDDYLSDTPRIVGAVFPNQRNRKRINEEEWRIHIIPIKFLFVSAVPVVAMRFTSKSSGKDYPSAAPSNATTVLEIQTTGCNLQGLDTAATPSDFSVSVHGVLYPDRKGRKGGLKGCMKMSIAFILPPALALVPDNILRGAGDMVIAELVEHLTREMCAGLVEDYKNFQREKLKQGNIRGRQQKKEMRSR